MPTSILEIYLETNTVSYDYQTHNIDCYTLYDSYQTLILNPFYVNFVCIDTIYIDIKTRF